MRLKGSFTVISDLFCFLIIGVEKFMFICLVFILSTFIFWFPILNCFLWDKIMLLILQVLFYDFVKNTTTKSSVIFLQQVVLIDYC